MQKDDVSLGDLVGGGGAAAELSSGGNIPKASRVEM